MIGSFYFFKPVPEQASSFLAFVGVEHTLDHNEAILFKEELPVWFDAWYSLLNVEVWAFDGLETISNYWDVFWCSDTHIKLGHFDGPLRFVVGMLSFWSCKHQFSV